MTSRTLRRVLTAILTAFFAIALAAAPAAIAAPDTVFGEDRLGGSFAAAIDSENPTAVLEAPQTAAVGASIPLSGEKSFDTGGGKVKQYRWTVPGRPPAETADPTFSVPGLPAGSYDIALVVTDDSGNQSFPDTRRVIVRDELAPTAVLDPPGRVGEGASIPLSGTRSFDSGGGRITSYRWTVAGRAPAVTAASTFNAPGLSPGTHQVSLVVVDDAGNQSLADTKSVEVLDIDNERPTAVLEGPSTAAVGASIPLSGARSSDAGGGSVVRYRWTVPGRPPAETVSSTFSVPGLAAGTYDISLVVIDDSGNESLPHTKRVVVRDDQAPTAVLDAPTQVVVGGSIRLSGVRSADAGGGEIVRYRWTVAGRSPVETTDPTFNAPGLTAGTHQVSLVVVDDAGNQSSPDTKSVEVRPPDTTKPTAVLDAPATAAVGAAIPLSGARSVDSGGGRVVRYRWTVPGRPPAETADPTFSVPGLAAGTYDISLVVTDDSGNESLPHAKRVVVRDDEAPTAVLDAPASALSGDTIPLSGGRSSDAGGGQIRTYRWTVAGRAPVETADPTFNAPGLTAGTHQVSLVVVDDAGNQSAPDTKSVNVSAPVPPPVVARDDLAPTAVLDVPASLAAGATIPLSGARSSDAGGGRIVRYRWTVAGRAPAETADPQFNAPGLPAGTHQVSLVVTDDAGNQSSPTTKVVTPRAPAPPAGTRIAKFGPTTLIAPVGKSTSQIQLGEGTLLAGRIFSPVATRLSADFSAKAGPRGKRVALGKTSISVPDGGAARLQVKLSKRVRKMLKGSKKLKVTMRTTARELASGKKTTTTRTLVFSIQK